MELIPIFIVALKVMRIEITSFQSLVKLIAGVFIVNQIAVSFGGKQYFRCPPNDGPDRNVCRQFEHV